MNTRPNTAAIFAFILGVTIAIAGPSFADLVRGDIVVFGDGETLTATDLNNNFDVLATAVEELEARVASNPEIVQIRSDASSAESGDQATRVATGTTDTSVTATCPGTHPVAVGGSYRVDWNPSHLQYIGGDLDPGAWTCLFQETEPSTSSESVPRVWCVAHCAAF